MPPSIYLLFRMVGVALFGLGIAIHFDASPLVYCTCLIGCIFVMVPTEARKERHDRQ